MYALYYYDDYFEDIMFTFKEGRDIALADIFLFPFIHDIRRKFFNYTIVYAPSSESKTKERGFLPLELLFRQVLLPKEQLFYKVNEYKQSSQEFRNRDNIRHVLRMNDRILKQKKILLVDDMCTSGSTLKYLNELLLSSGYKVKILTIGINKKLLNQMS